MVPPSNSGSRLRSSFAAHHRESFRLSPTTGGTPWLGFVVYPDHVAVKARKVRHARRRLRGRYSSWKGGAIAFAEFDASVQGRVNHVCQTDSWGLREHVLAPFELPRGCAQARTGRRR